MIYSIDDLKKRIAPIAVKYNLPAVYVFGSYARGEATDDSDVDILVDRTGSKVKGILIGGLYNDLCESFEKEVDMVTTAALEQENTKRDTPLFVENLKRERILIYERQ